MYSREEITNNIIDWTKKYLYENFTFYEYQLETITDIIYNIVNTDEDGHENYIIEAPTGSGKSIICIISAGVLAEYYNLRSYILCSDLYLWQQYYDFIIKNNLFKFGYLKGQTGNYNCIVNNEDLRNADCRLRGLSWKLLSDPIKAKCVGYKCAIICKYIAERKKAIRSDVCLMTYQLFLYMLNRSDNDFSFGGRDIIFCDECHNVPDIVQNKYTPVIKEENFKLLKNLYEIGQTEYENSVISQARNLEDKFPLYNEFKTYNGLQSILKSIFNNMCNSNTTNLDNVVSINTYIDIWDKFDSVVKLLESIIAQRKQAQNEQENDLKIYKYCSHYRNLMCHLHDFAEAIFEAGENYLIKQVEYDNDNIPSVIFNCVKEDYMVYKYLLNHVPHHVMLSATVGGKEAFEENVGIKYTQTGKTKMIRIPSTFDFSKSPIQIFTKYKMTYDKKDYSFEKLKPLIYKLINKFEGKKGLIQTGSYKNAKELYYTAPKEIQKRFLIYNDSKEKTTILKKHKMSKDTIIIGPTLAEGIDLPDDLCRFIIILKVPYPSLTSKLVQAKMKLFPNWYSSTASNLIIQGIGRGNRNKNDYCSTFILDGCFKRLFNETQNQYSEELKNRMKFYN